MQYVLPNVVSRITGASELRSDVDRLRNSLPSVYDLMDQAEWWRFKRSCIPRLLMRLQDAAYAAEDVIAQFDYYEPHQKIEGQIAGQLLSSLVFFLKNLASNFARKVKDAQTNLNSISCELKSELGLSGSYEGPNPFGKAVQRETTSLAEPVLGREDEVEMVSQLMLQPHDDTRLSNEASSSSSSGRAKRRNTDNFSVLPIVGIGGLGKTTLAQLIYNDDRVKRYFDLRIWVWVSDCFDLKMITREMIESANKELGAMGQLSYNEEQILIGENFTKLDSLQRILEKKLELRKYLLVLDDFWHEKTRDWENLCNPLRSGSRGSMILVTTRISKVAEIVGTLGPIKLGGLPDSIVWELFKNCAFRSHDASSYPGLEAIGRRIAAKLKGSPLAAKTLGDILCLNMTIERWMSILDSELWQLEQDDDGILAALQVSYHYLPAHLKRCFPIFSLFPKDFPLYVSLLSLVWMADGIIPRGENMFFEDKKGKEYIEEFESRSFILRGQQIDVLHYPMHDLAKSLSLYTCYCQDGKKWSFENQNTVRHLSVYRKPIEQIEVEIGKCKNLRSLLFPDGFNYDYKLGPLTLASWFNQLPYLRVLHLEKCHIEEIPENIGKLKLLFYINLKCTRIRSLPMSLCQLYNLRVVNVEGCPLESFPKMFCNLINLQLITEEMEISSKICGIGNLTSLERLCEFKVLKEDGHKIEELRNMTRLRGHIKISNLENVEGGRDAAQACLNNKEYLTELTLSWSSNRNINDTVSDEDIIEGLEPHPNLEILKIKNYWGRNPPSWLQAEKLPRLRKLNMVGCTNLENLEDWRMLHQLLLEVV